MYREFHYQVRGRGHLEAGLPCQDRTRYLTRGGIQVSCLADGAGSARFSDIGAQVLCSAGARLLVDRFAELRGCEDGLEVKRAIHEHLLARLASTAQSMHCELGDLAATFLAVVARDDEFLVVHVGDGLIGYVKNGEAKIISMQEKFEHANQTTFVTSRNAIGSMRLLRGSTDGVSGFVVMSDGAAASLHDQRHGSLAPACLQMIERVGLSPSRKVKKPAYKRVLKRFVDLEIRQRTTDDCSVGILAR